MSSGRRWEVSPRAFRKDGHKEQTHRYLGYLAFLADYQSGGHRGLCRSAPRENLCGNAKVRETFTDLMVPVPTAKEVKETGCVPIIQKLLEERLKFEELDAECLVNCDICQSKNLKSENGVNVHLLQHPCFCLKRITFNIDEKMDFTKEKTPVQIDEGLRIGGYEYELYHTIIQTGKWSLLCYRKEVRAYTKRRPGLVYYKFYSIPTQVCAWCSTFPDQAS